MLITSVSVGHALESVEKVRLQCIYFVRLEFFSFLIKACFQNKKTPLGYLKKISSSAKKLIEFMNYQFCTANEKETVTPKFSTKKLF